MTTVDPLLALLLALLAAYALVGTAHAVIQGVLVRRSRRRPRRRRPSAGYCPSVDVIVPCYNEAPETLRACLASLVAQLDYPGRLRVFVVDDGSANRIQLDEVYRIMRCHADRGWRFDALGRQAGKRQAQDRAFGQGTGELVLMVDSDTVLAPGAIQWIVSAFRSPRVGAVTGNLGVVNAGHNRLTRAIAGRYELLFEHERRAQGQMGSVGCCAGPFSMFRRAALADVWDQYLNQSAGWFGRRTTCTFGDDLVLTNLVLGLGFLSVFEPRARAFTMVPTTLRHFVRQQLRWNRSLYRDLVQTIKVIRHPCLQFDLAARTLLPPALGVLLVLLAAHSVVPGLAYRWQAATAVPLFVVALNRLWIRGTSASFFLTYGAVFVTLLVPVRFVAMLTPTATSWLTRTTTAEAPVVSVAALAAGRDELASRPPAASPC